MKKWVCATTLLLALPASAGDPDANYYQKAFEQWSSTVAELQNADTTSACTKEIERIRI